MPLLLFNARRDVQGIKHHQAFIIYTHSLRLSKASFLFSLTTSIIIIFLIFNLVTNYNSTAIILKSTKFLSKSPIISKPALLVLVILITNHTPWFDQEGHFRNSVTHQASITSPYYDNVTFLGSHRNRKITRHSLSSTYMWQRTRGMHCLT